MLFEISDNNATAPPGYAGSLSTSLLLYILVELILIRSGFCSGFAFSVAGIPNCLSEVSLLGVSAFLCSLSNFRCKISLEIKKPLNLEGA